jgi:hypothetical protein
MSTIPKRPQNICHSCHYTWYPRGKNLSRYCPYCGSTNTGLYLFGEIWGLWILLIVLALVLLVVL